MLNYDGLQDFIVQILLKYQWSSVSLVLDRTANAWFIGAFLSVKGCVRSNIRNNQLFTYVLRESDKHNEDVSFFRHIQETSRGTVISSENMRWWIHPFLFISDNIFWNYSDSTISHGKAIRLTVRSIPRNPKPQCNHVQVQAVSMGMTNGEYVS